jgi:hypothetical protein
LRDFWIWIIDLGKNRRQRTWIAAHAQIDQLRFDLIRII